MTTARISPERRSLSQLRQRNLEAERERLQDEIEVLRAARTAGPADIRAVTEGAERLLRIIAGTTFVEAGAAIAICDVVAPLLLVSPDPRAKVIGAALRGGCRIRRAIRRRT